MAETLIFLGGVELTTSRGSPPQVTYGVVKMGQAGACICGDSECSDAVRRRERCLG